MKVRNQKKLKVKKIFFSLLVFAGTTVSFANNKDLEVNTENNKKEIVTVIENKVVTVGKDDTCTITITRRQSIWDGSEATHVITQATGTGTTCEEAEANARKILSS